MFNLELLIHVNRKDIIKLLDIRYKYNNKETLQKLNNNSSPLNSTTI